MPVIPITTDSIAHINNAFKCFQQKIADTSCFHGECATEIAQTDLKQGAKLFASRTSRRQDGCGLEDVLNTLRLAAIPSRRLGMDQRRTFIGLAAKGSEPG